MYGNQSLVRTATSRSELAVVRPGSSASQNGMANARIESRNSNRKVNLANVEKNLLQQPPFRPYQHNVHPKEAQMVSFD